MKTIENFVFVVVEVFLHKEDVEVSKETNKANLLAPPLLFFSSPDRVSQGGRDGTEERSCFFSFSLRYVTP